MPSIIHDLELSVRTTNVLNAMGTVQTYDDFMALTQAEVRAQRGAGTKTWREIKEVQQNIGRDPWQEDLTALRDQAALAALQGLLANEYPEGVVQKLTGQHSLSVAAWAVADAFIAAREGKSNA